MSARSSEALANGLSENVKRATALYKYPGKIDLVIALPKTVSGKIRRDEPHLFFDSFLCLFNPSFLPNITN